MNNITVLHMLSCFRVGGAEKLILDVLENYHNTENIRYKVLILKDEVSEKYIKKLEELGVEFFIWKKREYKSPFRLIKLIEFIKKHKIDIIHTHEEGSKRWSLLCKVFKPDLKLIYTIHASAIIPSYSFVKKLLHNKLIDGTISIAKYIHKQCLDLNIANSYYINNCIDIKLFAKNRAQVSKNPEFLNIINVSRLSLYQKNQEVLIKALGECKKRGLNFKCNFVGGIFYKFPDAMQTVTELARQNNVDSEAFFLGDRDDVPGLLSEADLFILSSRFEGMPLVLLEAMAAGLPIIGSNIISINEFINHGENGLLFESENHLDLANKICELYHDREKLKFMAENAYNFVQGFDIQTMIGKYHELYRNVMKN